MTPTQLFVYGTLRHDQPEHAKYCRGVLGWQPARVRGRIVRVLSGYKLLLVPETAVLLAATSDANGDESMRAALPAENVATAARDSETAPVDWIPGELLDFRDAVAAWPPLDAWEDFAPGRSLAYERCVIPVQVETEAEARWLPAWAYVATREPPGAR